MLSPIWDEASLFRINREILHFVQNDFHGRIPFFNLLWPFKSYIPAQLKDCSGIARPMLAQEIMINLSCP